MTVQIILLLLLSVHWKSETDSRSNRQMFFRVVHEGITCVAEDGKLLSSEVHVTSEKGQEEQSCGQLGEELFRVKLVVLRSWNNRKLHETGVP